MDNDFLGNIAMLTKSLHQLNNPVPIGESRVDLSGISAIEKGKSDFNVVEKYMPKELEEEIYQISIKYS